MTKKNPFKKIETEVPLPEELKEDILQEVEDIIAESEGDPIDKNNEGKSEN